MYTYLPSVTSRFLAIDWSERLGCTVHCDIHTDKTTICIPEKFITHHSPKSITITMLFKHLHMLFDDVSSSDLATMLPCSLLGGCLILQTLLCTFACIVLCTALIVSVCLCAGSVSAERVRQGEVGGTTCRVLCCHCWALGGLILALAA